MFSYSVADVHMYWAYMRNNNANAFNKTLGPQYDFLFLNQSKTCKKNFLVDIDKPQALPHPTPARRRPPNGSGLVFP